VLARGSTLRVTDDLRTAGLIGAWYTIMLGRGGTTALTNGVHCEVRATYNNDTVRLPFGGVPLDSSSAAAATRLLSGSVASAGTLLAVTAAAIAAVGSRVLLWGLTALGTAITNGQTVTAAEWARIANANSSSIYLDAPLKQAHIQNEIVSDSADGWRVWMDAGATIEIIVDYADDAAGESVLVAAYKQGASN
jgi:hypothetical protein